MPRIICPNCSNAFTPAVGGVPECPKCHYQLVGYAPTSRAAPSFVAGATTISTPPPPVADPTVRTATGSNGVAVASMVLGIVGVPLFILIIPSLLALILGIVGFQQAKKNRQPGAGMAITGIVLGTLVLAGWLMFWFTMFMVFEF